MELGCVFNLCCCFSPNISEALNLIVPPLSLPSSMFVGAEHLQRIPGAQRRCVQPKIDATAPLNVSDHCSEILVRCVFCCSLSHKSWGEKFLFTPPGPCGVTLISYSACFILFHQISQHPNGVNEISLPLSFQCVHDNIIMSWFANTLRTLSHSLKWLWFWFIFTVWISSSHRPCSVERSNIIKNCPRALVFNDTASVDSQGGGPWGRESIFLFHKKTILLFKILFFFPLKVE